MSEQSIYVERVPLTVRARVLSKSLTKDGQKATYDVQLSSGHVMLLKMVPQVTYNQGDTVDFVVQVPKTAFCSVSQVAK